MVWRLTSLQPAHDAEEKRENSGKNADVIFTLYHLIVICFFVHARLNIKEKGRKIIFTIMQPIPIVANFALSSERPELMKSEVE
jgi:hypothetical protein